MATFHAYVVKTSEQDGRPFEFHTVQTSEQKAEKAFRKIHRHWKRSIEVVRLFPDPEKKGAKT